MRGFQRGSALGGSSTRHWQPRRGGIGRTGLQGPIPFGIGLLTLLLAMAGGWPVLAFGAAAQPVLEEVEVIAPRSVAAVLPTSASALALDAEVLERVAATHVHEVALRVPGVWISRGSGQEHLTAIRSPVLTGPGACGSFQLLEDGIPVRPNGFCNVNNLFELNTEQAQRLEFVRGPASASFGGNAQRGVINRVSALDPPQELRLEGGPEGFYRAGLTGTAALGEQQFSFALHSEHSGGYRDATGYGQQKANLTHRTEVAGWRVLTTFAGTLLNQETGGFVSGFEVYEDDDLRSTNPNPEAYRDAWALRLTSHWQKGDWIISPYLRRSDMAFLQHFLPGQPLEENDHTSGGVILRRAFAGGQRFTGQAGLQLEWFDSALREFQDGPTIGSAFLVATRPPGLHYDYTVEGLTAAAFYDVDWALSDDGALRIEHSLRLEQLRYDYDNRTLVGNTRDDGTPCGFGGCRYSRPPSGTDRFDDIAGRLGLVRDVGAGALYAQLGRGFRPPQATELYRLQNGQTLADLNSETVDALELGFRSEGLAVALFAQRSRDLIFRDADGFNVTGGRTRAEGIEFFWQHSVGRHGFDIATTYARHRYDFSTPLAGGESISSGDAVDTAPRWQGSARWRFAPLPTVLLEAEIVGLGSYQLNASNTARYDGHWLGNLRARWQVSERLSATLRLNNVTDAQYADRADFAFGSYRYFPGLPRQVYLGMSLRL